jgi:hypothetical protein
LGRQIGRVGRNITPGLSNRWDKIFILLSDAFLLMMDRWTDQEARAVKTRVIF